MSGEKGVLPSYTINIQSQAMIKMLLVLMSLFTNLQCYRRKKKERGNGQKEGGRWTERETDTERDRERETDTERDRER